MKSQDQPAKKYASSLFNPRGDTNVGIKTKSGFPFVETYNYTPKAPGGESGGNAENPAREQNRKKPMGQYTDQMKSSRRSLGGPHKLGTTPLENITSMYPTKKETKHNTPMMRLMAKRKRIPLKETESEQYLRTTGNDWRPGPNAKIIKKETNSTPIEGGKQRYNAYLRKFEMKKGIQKGNEEGKQESLQDIQQNSRKNRNK